MSGFRDRRAWREAFPASPPPERLAQAGERGGSRV
jgi:hypothetical protein